MLIFWMKMNAQLLTTTLINYFNKLDKRMRWMDFHRPLAYLFSRGLTKKAAGTTLWNRGNAPSFGWRMSQLGN